MLKNDTGVPEDQSTYGPWMVAQTRRPRGSVRKTAEPVRKPNGVSEGVSGSRYAALADDHEKSNHQLHK